MTNSTTPNAKKQRLLPALGKIDPKLADWYCSALEVVDSTIPDRFALSAHQIREIMMKLPNFIGVASHDSRESLGSKFNEYKDKVKQSAKNIDFNVVDFGDSQHQKKIIVICEASIAIIEWHDKNFIGRREETKQVLREIDAAEVPLPEELEEIAVKHWQVIYEYFLSVAHHNKSTDNSEFRKWLHAFERFVIERLEPGTTEAFALAEEIIRKGEEMKNG